MQFRYIVIMPIDSVFCVLLFILILPICTTRLSEEERVKLWRERNVWPPQWQEDSVSYKSVMDSRETEIMQLTGSDERWENWMQFIQGRLLPRFTAQGFAVIQTPPHVHAKLKQAVDRGIEQWDSLPFENNVKDSIYGGLTPKFVDMGTLATEVGRDLQHLHEEWALGMALRPTSSYGVRLYQNGSTMVMHNDKTETHVISSIVHIAHSYDDDTQPWPIQIEDHDGKLHSVSLEEGQMMFYESAKCLHGRMTSLRGKYYGSIFVHYAPVDKSVWNYTTDDVIASVPPHWADGITDTHGSRWCGQCISVDSRLVEGAPPRIEGHVTINAHNHAGRREL